MRYRERIEYEREERGMRDRERIESHSLTNETRVGFRGKLEVNFRGGTHKRAVALPLPVAWTLTLSAIVQPAASGRC